MSACWCDRPHAPIREEEWASRVWIPIYVAVHLYGHLNSAELVWWIRCNVLRATRSCDSNLNDRTVVLHDDVPKTVPEMVERRRAARVVDRLTRSSE